MLDELVAHSEAFLVLSAACSIIFGVVIKYVIKPHRDKSIAVDKALRDDITIYRENTSKVLSNIVEKLDRIEDDQHKNHVCAKEHTRELKDIKHNLDKGAQVMDDLKNRGVDTSLRLSKMEGTLAEHLRKT